jgi:hypothetical protein
MVVNNIPGAITALQHVWDTRWRGAVGYDPLLPHHHAVMWEGNWLLDYIHDHPDVWTKLHQKWNWMVGNFEHVPEAEAHIHAFHGGPHDRRWASFVACHAAFYGTANPKGGER